MNLWFYFNFAEVKSLIMDEIFTKPFHPEDLKESFKCPLEDLMPGRFFQWKLLFIEFIEVTYE